MVPDWFHYVSGITIGKLIITPKMEADRQFYEGFLAETFVTPGVKRILPLKMLASTLIFSLKY